MLLKTERLQEPILATDGNKTWFMNERQFYKCDHCGDLIQDSFPHYANNNIHYCIECSFLMNLIDEKDYLRYSGLCDIFKATIRNNEIFIAYRDQKYPWEKTDKDYRNCKSYQQWRNNIFERDNYTCQKCGKYGGELNAHHKKPFKQFPELRYELDNGITLCVKCHKEKRNGENRK